MNTFSYQNYSLSVQKVEQRHGRYQKDPKQNSRYKTTMFKILGKKDGISGRLYTAKGKASELEAKAVDMV